MANVKDSTKLFLSMIGTLETKDKQNWKDYLPTIVQAYSCTKNNATDFSPYYLMYRHKARLPIDIRFSITSPQSEECSHKKFLAKLHNSYGGAIS